MGVMEFNEKIQNCRADFRALLDEKAVEVKKTGMVKSTFADWLIEHCFSGLTNEFEERTMSENLNEEFGIFLSTIQGV